MIFDIRNKKTINGGFTLIELLIVVAIIGILASVVLVSLSNARLKARDARRKTELSQLKRVMDMYYADHGYYPKESEGANGKIGEGSGLSSMLAPYTSSALPYDPLGPGDSTHYYYYDGNQFCGGSSNISVIFAANLEGSPGNRADFCVNWGGEGGAGGANAWHIVLGPSAG